MENVTISSCCLELDTIVIVFSEPENRLLFTNLTQNDDCFIYFIFSDDCCKLWGKVNQLNTF